MWMLSVMAFAQDEICYDCLTENVLYRFAGPTDPYPHWWSPEFDEAASVTILFGVIEGGGGLTITPGGKPIPIDPEWLLVAGTYADERDLASQIDRLGDALDAQRLGWTQLTEVSDTARLQGTVAVVTPRDEAAAVAWIAENARTLAGLDHPTVVFLQDAGAAAREIPVYR
jgi:hypothetical protein